MQILPSLAESPQGGKGIAVGKGGDGVTRRRSVFPKGTAAGGDWPVSVSGFDRIASLACDGTRGIDSQNENQSVSGLPTIGEADEHHRHSQSLGRGFAQRQPERHQGRRREPSPNQCRHGCFEEVEI